MTAPQVILFDCMDTLVKDPFWTVFPEFFGQPLPDLFRQVRREAWPEFEKGLIDEPTYFASAFSDGRTYDGEALKTALYDGYRYIDGIEDLLRELQQQGVEMHVLSNYPVWYRMIEDKLTVSRFMPWTFVSTLTGHRKPDAAAYTQPLATLKRAPGEVLFVDDRQSNTDSAEAVGLHAHVFQDAATLREHLKDLQVL